jgi:inosine-uridine nucleoside N-ribohydrolase
MKVIVDTDIGSDIDDALALSYLLAKPGCELLGITTVTGETEKRAMIADALCHYAGRDIPVYPGASYPLNIKRPLRPAVQAEVLKKWNHKTTFPVNMAIQFLRDTIYKYPGDITLLTLGPLTNIAGLFTLYPEVPAMLKGIVLMCGYFEQKQEGWNKCEWNASWDYDAADISWN